MLNILTISAPENRGGLSHIGIKLGVAHSYDPPTNVEMICEAFK